MFTSCERHDAGKTPLPRRRRFTGHLRKRTFTIRRAAQILGRDEELLWDLSDQLEPEDGKLWVLDIDGAEMLAFSEFGIETLREIIADQVDRKR